APQNEPEPTDPEAPANLDGSDAQPLFASELTARNLVGWAASKNLDDPADFAAHLASRPRAWAADDLAFQAALLEAGNGIDGVQVGQRQKIGVNSYSWIEMNQKT
ncbi:MAG TPA: hypothetical protein VFT74_07685, partial [Isosphaeraceae bacterium]|nr:hypothetical protein [Isosphaeraceae bacterium]